MSANRKPSKATDTEIREFYKKTKDIISKNGMYFDPITKKYPEESARINEVGIRKVIDQVKGKGVERLVFVSTCSNYGLIEGDRLFGCVGKDKANIGEL